LKKPTNVKKLKEKVIRKKRKVESFNWEGLNFMRVSVCQAVWIDRGDARA